MNMFLSQIIEDQIYFTFWIPNYVFLFFKILTENIFFHKTPKV